jgi:hypothetical protein
MSNAPTADCNYFTNAFGVMVLTVHHGHPGVTILQSRGSGCPSSQP